MGFEFNLKERFDELGPIRKFTTLAGGVILAGYLTFWGVNKIIDMSNPPLEQQIVKQTGKTMQESQKKKFEDLQIYFNNINNQVTFETSRYTVDENKLLPESYTDGISTRLNHFGNLEVKINRELSFRELNSFGQKVWRNCGNQIQKYSLSLDGRIENVDITDLTLFNYYKYSEGNFPIYDQENLDRFLYENHIELFDGWLTYTELKRPDIAKEWSDRVVKISDGWKVKPEILRDYEAGIEVYALKQGEYISLGNKFKSLIRKTPVADPSSQIGGGGNSN